MSERRYTEAEVSEIFRAAAELEHATPRALAPSEGLTLSELERIGEEAGIRPDLIRRAAGAHIDAGQGATVRLIGLPIGVSHTVDLDRVMSDDEWALLVGTLRETFDAKGLIRTDGAFRQWTNGNLHVMVEPTQAASRVRMRTRNGLSQATIGVGLFLVMMGALVALLSGGLSMSLVRGAILLMGIGAPVAIFGALRLPAWAGTRRRQMAELAKKLASGTLR